MAKRVNRTPPQPATTVNIIIPKMERRQMALRLTGTAPLLVSRFDEKAIVEMLSKHMGREVDKMQKDPQRDFEARKYRNTKGQDCVPVMTVKSSIVEAATLSKNKQLSKKVIKGGLTIVGMCIPIRFETVSNQMDITKNANKQPDIRFRPCYSGWSLDVVVDYNARLLSADQVIYLFREAGVAIGICEWRPQRNGVYGTWEVDTLPDSEISRIKKECAYAPKPLQLPKWVVDLMISQGSSMEEIAADAKRLADEERKPRRNGRNGISHEVQT